MTNDVMAIGEVFLYPLVGGFSVVTGVGLGLLVCAALCVMANWVRIYGESVLDEIRSRVWIRHRDERRKKDENRRSHL